MEAGERLIGERERERERAGEGKATHSGARSGHRRCFLHLLGFDDNRGGGPEKLNFAAALRG